MNKKIFLFVFLALLAGEIAGYTGRSLSDASTNEDENKALPAEVARPRFGITRQGDSPADSRRKVLARSNESEMAKLDDTLKQYTRMSTEELWKELEVLSKQTERHIYSPNTTREVLMSYLFTRLGQEAPRQTLALMKDKKSTLADYKYAVLDVWGKKDPEAAMAYCRENMESDPENSHLWKSSYVEFLSESSPDKAIDYLFTLSPEESAEYSKSVVFYIASETPEKMTKIMERLLPLMKVQRGMEGYIASQWAQSDWDAAERWIKTLPEERQHRVMGRAVSGLPQEEALKKIGALDEKGKLVALAELSNSLYWASPVKAMDIVLKNATEEQALKILEQGFYPSNIRDDKVNSYVKNLPAGAIKDRLLEKAINNQSPYNSDSAFFDPKMEDAFSLIDQMSSAEKKEKATVSTLNQWLYREPQKVKSWVEQSRLSDDQKKQFIQQCDNAVKSKKENK